MFRTTIVVTALAVAGCVGVPVEERAAACQAMDWSNFGKNDGILGVPAADRAGLFRDCQDLSQPVDLAAYTAGRTEGLKSYCTVESGLQVGSSGRSYRQVCSPETETACFQGFKEGRKAIPARARRIARHRYFFPRFGFKHRYGLRGRFGFHRRFFRH